MLERTKRYLYEDRISQIKSPTNTCRLEYSGSYQRTKVIDVYSARSEVIVGVFQMNLRIPSFWYLLKLWKKGF